MTPQERQIFSKHVEAGRTPVRYKDEESVTYGIVMETVPYADIDSDSFGHAHVEMPVVAWFSGHVSQFPLCLLHFDIDGEWWGIDDILMGEFE